MSRSAAVPKFAMTVLVVLPGLDGTATLHSAFADAVHMAFDSVAIISYPPSRFLDYIALEEFVRAQLPPVASFVLLGESFSGPIALSIAAAAPPNLAGVVLSTTFAESPVPLLAPFTSLLRFAPVRIMPLPLMSWLLLGRWATPQLESALQNALLSVTPEVLRSRAVAALRVKALASCRTISKPVLYLRATRDRLLSRHAGRQISNAIPHSVTADIAGPHLLLQAVPRACADAIGEFASRLET
jgi:pimeloyl-[acyl-carrier protein] methyl ester esterase